MVDPVVAPLFGVAVAFTKVLLRSTNNNLSADIIDDTAGPLAGISQLVLGKKGSKKQVERAIKRDLDTRMRDMNERCNREGIDPSRLASPCAEVEAVLDTIGDHNWILETAVRDPNALRTYFREQALKQRAQVDERLVPYFDELIKAVAEQYINYAERSPNYLRVAAKQSLKNDKESRESTAKILDAVDDVRHMVGKFASSDSKPSRVFFGSRPDAVAGERFVERDEHEQLKAVITDPTRHRTVLWGMRGCGKTQLAASLAKQCEEANWSIVAWINAVSRESIQSDLVELAKQLGIGTSDQPAQNEIIRRCLDHLKSAAPADRLIVFDNVEDINDLRSLVPSGDGLRVVATTTNNVGWKDQAWRAIRVGMFDRSESIDYLLRVTKSDDRDAADTLAERLGDLPLAIAQAGATARLQDLSLARYLKRLESRRQEPNIRAVPGDEHTDDVAMVLWMAVEAAVDSMKNDGTKQMGRRQLGALALLAESGVPTRWLDPTVEQLDDDESPDTQRDTDEDAHDALTELIHRFIVQQSADGTTTLLHRLQAQVLRNSWNNNELDDARAAATGLLGSVNISRYPSNDTKVRRQEALDLVDQLRSIGTQEYSQVLFESPHTSEALFHAFSHASDLGLPYEALTLDVAVDALEGLLGPDHPDTLASRNNLAYAYRAAGRLEEAITLYEQVTKDSARVLGPDHPDTLASRNNLAETYRSVGRTDEAITLHEQVLADSIRVLGEDHHQTLASRNNLACAYEAAGRTGEAITLYEQVLADSIRMLGEDNPHTLASRNNLAYSYDTAGRTDEAITLYEQVLADSIRMLGEDHPDTLGSRNNLACAYEAAGRTNAAITLYEQVLADSIRMLGEDHPQTLTLRNNLACAYEAAGRTDAAITLYEQVLADRIRILGEDHLQTLASYNNLAYSYVTAGRTDEAITLYEEVLADSIRILGEDHPQTLTSGNNLANAYETAGRLTEAITLYKLVLADRIRILGEDHPQTIASYNNLANAYETAGRTDENIALFEQILSVRMRVFGEDHPDTLTSRNNLAYAYYAVGRLEEAITLFEQVLTDRIRILGEDHPDTLTSRNNLAYAYYAVGRLEEAIALYEQVTKDCARVLGEDHPLTKTVRENLEAARRELAQREDSSPTEEREED